jgi:hypothetical protein
MLLADRPTTSRWAPLAGGERSYQVRPILEGKNRGRHFVRKTPSPEVNRIRSQTSVRPSTLRKPSLARAPKIQHRDRIPGERSYRRVPRWRCLWRRWSAADLPGQTTASGRIRKSDGLAGELRAGCCFQRECLQPNASRLATWPPCSWRGGGLLPLRRAQSGSRWVSLGPVGRRPPCELSGPQPPRHEDVRLPARGLA